MKSFTIHRSKAHCCYTARIWIILLTCAILPMYHSQMITNKPAEDEFYCPGQELVFTCETRGSIIITWRSAEYIGPNRLEFSDGRVVGNEESSGGTVATLTRNVNENGQQVLESQLHVTVGSSVSSPSISCARDSGVTDSITLRVLVAGSGDVPIISDQRKNSVGGCVVHFSWAPPSDLTIRDISHYEIAINGTRIDDETNITKVAMRAHPLCTCGTHHISIATVNHCGGVGPNVTQIVNNPEPDNVICEASSNDGSVTPPNNDNDTMGCENKSSTDFRIGLIIACLLLILSLAAALILAIMLTCMCCGCIAPMCGKEKKNNRDNLDLDPSSDKEKSPSIDKEKESRMT